jgi:hypothetical protein
MAGVPGPGLVYSIFVQEVSTLAGLYICRRVMRTLGWMDLDRT